LGLRQIPQVRSGNVVTHTIKRRYSARGASMHSDPTSELAAGSSAVAVAGASNFKLTHYPRKMMVKTRLRSRLAAAVG
jgi:hypothetical protein